jgi:phage terminase large subunit
MEEIELDYQPRAQQFAIHEGMEGKRFGAIVTHRKMGKTVMAVNHLIRGALTCTLPRPRFGYIAPTYSQGKSISFDYIKHYSDPIPGRSINQSELRVDYPNGSQVRIYGADNPDNLRGLYFDGVVLDEYGLFQPKTFSEVIGPTLVDRGGWAIFMGTPNGKNQFYEQIQRARANQAAGDPNWYYAEFKASQTGLLDPAFLEAQRSQMTADEYAQEFECSFEASVKGAIYAKELEAARAQGRVTSIPVDPALPVDTDWDLGIGDSMAIWFSQSLRTGEVRLIDYYEAQGEGFPHYMQLLRSKGYTYGKHWAPHDIQVRELSTGRSRLDVAASLGLRFELTPRLQTTAAGEVEEGIHAVRMFLPRCWFDATRCKAGLEALMHYRRDYNTRLGEFKATPVHDHASHGADAFRGLAVRHEVPRETKRQAVAQMPLAWNWS